MPNSPWFVPEWLSYEMKNETQDEEAVALSLWLSRMRACDHPSLLSSSGCKFQDQLTHHSAWTCLVFSEAIVLWLSAPQRVRECRQNHSLLLYPRWSKTNRITRWKFWCWRDNDFQESTGRTDKRSSRTQNSTSSLNSHWVEGQGVLTITEMGEKAHDGQWNWFPQLKRSVNV